MQCNEAVREVENDSCTDAVRKLLVRGRGDEIGKGKEKAELSCRWDGILDYGWIRTSWSIIL